MNQNNSVMHMEKTLFSKFHMVHQTLYIYIYIYYLLNIFFINIRHVLHRFCNPCDSKYCKNVINMTD